MKYIYISHLAHAAISDGYAKKKIIIGDKSDNIPKIQNGLQKSTALKIALMNDEDRMAYLISNKIIDNFNLNKKLIDFTEIPEIISEKFYEYYNIIIE